MSRNHSSHRQPLPPSAAVPARSGTAVEAHAVRAGAAALAATAVLLTAGLAGCDESGAEPSAPATTRQTVRVGMAYDVGGRGDKTFNDSAAAGLERAKADLDVQAKELEAQKGEGDDDRYARLQLLCGAGYDLVVAVGMVYAGDPRTGPLARAVQDCPKTRFAIVDDATTKAPNLANLVFAEEQGSFLVGAAAALKSRTGRVGFIGGCDITDLRKFHAGYQAGVRAVRPGVTVVAAYLSTLADNCSGFRDPAKGRLTAATMYRNGADVVFTAAGASGAGAFEAAKAAGRWAIGVDSDQYLTTPEGVREVIITSMIKRVDVAVFEVVKQVARGTFRAGIDRFDLSTDGVGYTTSGGKINDIAPRLDDLKRKIVAGTIKVPTQP